jgi:hypothetical protein
LRELELQEELVRANEERDASNALALSEQETCEKLVFLLTDKESTIQGLREELREAQEVLSCVGVVLERHCVRRRAE